MNSNIAFSSYFLFGILNVTANITQMVEHIHAAWYVNRGVISRSYEMATNIDILVMQWMTWKFNVLFMVESFK